VAKITPKGPEKHKRYYVDVPTFADWERSGLTVSKTACPYSPGYPIVVVEGDVKVSGHRGEHRASLQEKGHTIYGLDRYLNIYNSHNIQVAREEVRTPWSDTKWKRENGIATEIKQETVMVYLVCAVKKATVRQQEDGLGDTLVGELKAISSPSETGAIAQYTRNELKDVTDLTGVDVVVKNF
jgi:hypothetical protein